MAARATWKGFLKVSLVNIPIKVFPATESSGTISFNQLHSVCQTPHPAEAVVSDLQHGSGEHRHREGLRVREGPLRRPLGGRHRQGSAELDARDRSRAVRRCGRARSDVRRSRVLPCARRPGRGRRVRRDARRHEREDRRRQARALRPRIPRRGEAARQGPRDVHAASRRGDSRAWTASKSWRRYPRR